MMIILATEGFNLPKHCSKPWKKARKTLSLLSRAVNNSRTTKPSYDVSN